MSLHRPACFLLFFALVMAALGLCAGVSTVAHAEPKPWIWSWWPSHWDNMTFKPYLEEPKEPHNNQWSHKNWEPADWSAQEENGARDVIQGFYTAGILQDQQIKDDVPVLVVGPNFYHLSGYDKRRVVQMVDDYYQVTASKLNGMFTLTDGRTNRPIGVYSANGLQLQ